jgi:hypothetical protein
MFGADLKIGRQGMKAIESELAIRDGKVVVLHQVVVDGRCGNCEFYTRGKCKTRNIETTAQSVCGFWQPCEIDVDGGYE